jgi:hypothetical protein
LIGYFDNSAKIFWHWFVQINFNRWLPNEALLLVKIDFGFTSNCSKKIPSFVIFPLIFLSAEHETPIPTGQEAA